MTISDEMLMAYLDNELSPDERAVIDAALKSDSDVRARLERQERVHRMLSAAFDPAISQAVPERLATAAMTTPVSFRWQMARLFDRTAIRGARRLPRYAMAAMATVVVVVAAGYLFMSGDPGRFSEPPFTAQGDLAQALQTQLASEEGTLGPRIGVSFRARDGSMCRSFDLGGAPDNFAGVACRGWWGWTVNTYVSVPMRSGRPYETAGAGMPEDVRAAVSDQIDGEPFDADAERRARDEGWR